MTELMIDLMIELMIELITELTIDEHSERRQLLLIESAPMLLEQGFTDEWTIVDEYTVWLA